MRQFIDSAENRISQVSEKCLENEIVETFYPGIFKKIRDAATKAFRDLGFSTVSVYDVKNEGEGYNIHFNGVLSAEDRKKAISIISKEINLTPEKIGFVGLYRH